MSIRTQIGRQVKAYSYIRFSSSRQAEGDSVRRQTALAKAYSETNDLDLQDVSHSDYGVSAFRGDNASTGALGAFIKLVEDNEVDAGSYLLIESFDRLSRQSIEEALQLFLQIVNLGIIIVTLSDNQKFEKGKLDMTKLIISITIMSRANEESLMKSRRTKAVWTKRKGEARLDGKFIRNSNHPRWLKRVDDTLILPPENQAIIRQVFDWAIAGYGYSKIADMLNNKKQFTFHRGKAWVSGNISNLLRNKAIIGEYQPHIRIDGKRVKDGEPIVYYPQVITPAVFVEAQAAIDNRNKRGSGYRKGTFMNLFTGLIRCSECNKSVVLGSMYKKSGAMYLKCSAGCKGRLRYQYIEPQILTALSQLRRVTDKYKKPTSNELAIIQLEINRLESNMAELSNLLIKFPSEATAIALQGTEEQHKELKEREASITDKNAVDAIKGTIVLGRENLKGAEARGIFNSKLRAVLDNLILDINNNTMVYIADGLPILEQHIKRANRKMSTRIFEMDGTLVGETNKDRPLELIMPNENSDTPDFDLIPEIEREYIVKIE